MIARPGQYLLAVSKEDLKIIMKALDDWTGPYPDNPGQGFITPIQAEYQEDQMERALDLKGEIQEALAKEGGINT
jgi:hypothetical protein